MSLPLSIIIPTFNEEKYLPKLLISLKKQTWQPREIIVADNFSIDNTRAIAEAFHCTIINGGNPGKARNNGANIATQPYLLFLDADVILPKTFLEKTFQEMRRRNLDVASCYVSALSDEKIVSVGTSILNNYWRLMKYISPRVGGFCMFVKKPLHQKISGFDESIVFAEDSEYMQRAWKHGDFDFLLSAKIPVSIRRFKEDGKIRHFLKSLLLEAYITVFGKIRKNFVSYEFGKHYEN